VTRQLQKEKWDRLAAGMSDFYGAASTQYYRACEQNLVRRAFGNLAGVRLLKLDLWNEAFNTRILHWAREEGARIFAVDLSDVVTRTAAERAAEAGVELALAKGDIRELPYADDSFDCVYTMGTIEHIEEYDQALREIHRVLRPGGRAVVGVPNKHDPWLRPLLVELMQALDVYPYSPEKAFSSAELQREVEAAGLELCFRSGILAYPGLLRMAELWCYTRGLPLHHLARPLVRPFEWLETGFAWAGHLGYLLAHVVQKNG